MAFLLDMLSAHMNLVLLLRGWGMGVGPQPGVSKLHVSKWGVV